MIGAAKCATTTLWEHLRRHPQIFMASDKELRFFSRDDVFARGWAWYEPMFAGAGGKPAIGEGSTCYTKLAIFPNASGRIAECLPQAKLIYIVRNPIERIESYQRHLLARGHDVLSFDELLRHWPEAVDTSRYWRQISAYRAHFPDERILVLFFEELVKEPKAVLKRCFEFLRVDASLARPDLSLAVNASKDERMDGPLIRFVRKMPGVEPLKRAAPAVSKAIGSTLRRPMPDRPIWPARLRHQVIDQLADDTASILRHCGKPADFWQLD